MAQMQVHDGEPWGWRPAVLPGVALAALIIVGNVVTHFVRPDSLGTALAETILVDLLLYGALVVVVYVAGRDLADRYGGWGWTFGLQRPKWMDGAWVAAGVGMVLGGRVAVVLIANAATHGKAGQQAQNLTVHSRSPAVYAVIAVVVVLLAPVIEETVFRGLLLRTFMRRLGFWRAALLSSLVFAAFHTYQVDTLAGALTLAGVVFVLGLANCLLVRWSGRLAAGVFVHALFNGLAVVVLVIRNTG